MKIRSACSWRFDLTIDQPKICLRGAAPVLETARLLLVPRCAEDNAHLYPLFNDWEVIRFLSVVVPWPYPEDGVEKHWRDLEARAATGEEFCWTLRPKEAPDIRMGQINLRAPHLEEHRGFWIGQPYRKRGFMQEAADEITRYAFEDQELPLLRIGARIDNDGSNRIKEKQGFREVGRMRKTYAGEEEHDSIIWELTRAEYLARHVR